MELTKMTLHLPEELLAQARHISRENDANLNTLINAFQERIVAGHESLTNIPTTPRLTDTLPPEAVEEYYNYLDGKYAQMAEG